MSGREAGNGPFEIRGVQTLLSPKERGTGQGVRERERERDRERETVLNTSSSLGRLLVSACATALKASHSLDTQRGLHALYSRTNAPVYHDGLALLRPGALVRMSPRARTYGVRSVVLLRVLQQATALDVVGFSCGSTRGTCRGP